MAYILAVHESTGQSPSKVIFGKDLKLPCDRIFGSPKAEELAVYGYADKLEERLLEIHNMVSERI